MEAERKKGKMEAERMAYKKQNERQIRSRKKEQERMDKSTRDAFDCKSVDSIGPLIALTSTGS
jgi:hypothetical protein